MVRRYPLQNILERVARSRKVALAEKSPEELVDMRLEPMFSEELDSIEEEPVILIGRSKTLDLYYLGHIGLWHEDPQKIPSYARIPEGILVASGSFRTLKLEANIGRYLGKPMATLYICFRDQTALRLLPKIFRDYNKREFGEHTASLKATPSNLKHAEELLRELF